MSSERLGNFLKEVSNWDWEQFTLAERNKEYTTNQSVIFALVRACSMQKMDAIRIALNRLDGKLKTPVRIEYPKIYYLYPNAKNDKSSEAKMINKFSPASEVDDKEVLSGEIIPAPEIPKVEPKDLPSMGLRETLTEMSDYPRELPEAIVGLALQTEQALRGEAVRPTEIPKVKSVVAAHLLVMAQNRSIDALTEVFDQIDGKLVETLQLIGEDIYITSFALEAPPEARLNENGVLQMEATQSQQHWAQKLGKES